MTPFRFCPRCACPLSATAAGGRERLACAAPGCGFVHWDNPVPVVAALVTVGGNAVLVRNRGWPEKMYGLVSGFLERGETPEQGVLREVREELGLEGRVESFLGLVPFEPMNQLLVGYHVCAQGEPRAGEELAAIKLVPVAKLKPWPLGTGFLVEAWLKRRAP